jgi:uncharacterized LabA/DUF88 family protein
MPTAIFVDADFFLSRFPQVYRDKDKDDPALVAKTLHEMALDHLTQPSETERKDLLRIFVYDYPPHTGKAHYPKSKEAVDFATAPGTTFRSRFHEELTRQRKVVLRLGRLKGTGSYWRLKKWRLELLLVHGRKFESFTDDDFEPDVMQRGIEIKIGLDIASVAYKKQADQIVLVADDASFVPAAKLARREGIDFILDPMWKKVAGGLHEHIDGLRSTCPRELTREERTIAKKRKNEAAENEKAPPPAAVQTAETESSGADKITPLFK